MIIHGSREWTDYRIVADLVAHLAEYAGIGLRVQGLRRYYAALLVREGSLRIVKAYDGASEILAQCPFDWTFETRYEIAVQVTGASIRCTIGAIVLEAHDRGDHILREGGMALIICGGAMSSNELRVMPTTVTEMVVT